MIEILHSYLKGEFELQVFGKYMRSSIRKNNKYNLQFASATKHTESLKEKLSVHYLTRGKIYINGVKNQLFVKYNLLNWSYALAKLIPNAFIPVDFILPITAQSLTHSINTVETLSLSKAIIFNLGQPKS